MKAAVLVLLLCAVFLFACSEGELPPGKDGPVTYADGKVDRGAQKEASPADVEVDRGGDLGKDGPAADLPAPDQLAPDQQVPDLLAPDTGPTPIDKCLNAKMLTLVNGKVTETGDTAPLTDEFAKLTCGGSVALAGPQAYYMLLLSAGESYKITVAPKFDAYYYIFSPMSVCTEASIQKDCSSQGGTGDTSSLVTKGGSKTISFKVLKTGYWYIAVDSAGAAHAGAFTLTIELDCEKFDDKCNTGINDKGVCKAKPKSGTCTDEDPCTQNDKCVNKSGLGICEGTAKVCPGNTCNTGKCDKTNGLCVNIPKAGQCNDSDPCTLYDQCQAGACKGKKMDCSSVADTCNLGLCLKGTCTKVPKSGNVSCNDNDACTVNDTCSNGVCKGKAKSCAGDQCNNGGCAVIAGTATCVKVYKKGFCNDGNLCTVKDTCQNASGVGVCKGTTTTCSGDTCNIGTCQPKTGQCKKTYKPGSCNDSDLCTHSDKCVSSGGVGVCKGTTKTCTAKQCHSVKCSASSGSCVYTAKSGGSCNDLNSCTVNDTCSYGTCKGSYTGDGYESNNSCGQRKYLGAVNEGSTWISKAATIAPPTDVDWFYANGYEGTHACVPWSSQKYYFKVRVYVPAGRTFKACVGNNSCSVSCKTGSGVISLQYTRSGKCAYTDNTTGYIMVQAVDGKTGCKSYTVSFNYND